MFDDLIKTNDEEIRIIISRKIINELYALHGEVGIEGATGAVSELLKKSFAEQIKYNLDQDKDYYNKVTNKIFTDS